MAQPNVEDLMKRMAKLEQENAVLKSTVDKQSSKILKQSKTIKKLQGNGLNEKLREQFNQQAKKIQTLTAESMTDQMTGIRNRTGFEKDVNDALNTNHRRGQDSQFVKPEVGGVFAMLDLDKFKLINDTHGHAAGDACLQLVAVTIQSMLRSSDTAARLGGDEFVFFLNGQDIENEEKKALKIQKELNTLVLDWEDKQGNIQHIKIGASMGLSSCTEETAFQKLYEGADAALYKNKAARNGGKIPVRDAAPVITATASVAATATVAKTSMPKPGGK